MAYVIGEKAMNNIVSKHVEVQAELKHEAEKDYARAQSMMSHHHKSGNAKVELEHGDVDYYIVLDDPDTADQPGDALAIEFGHWNKRTHRYTEGIHVLTKSTGMT